MGIFLEQKNKVKFIYIHLKKVRKKKIQHSHHYSLTKMAKLMRFFNHLWVLRGEQKSLFTTSSRCYYFVTFSVVYHMTVAQATVNVVKVYFFIIKESCELMSTLNGGIFLFYMWRKSCCYYKILTNSANFLTRTLKKWKKFCVVEFTVKLSKLFLN